MLTKLAVLVVENLRNSFMRICTSGTFLETVESCYNDYTIFLDEKKHLLSRIFKLTSVLSQGSDIRHHHEKANAFCEAIRALDATGSLLFLSFPVSIT